ncbi:MAG: glycosyl transferase group 1 [Ignavibacteriae bacterium]|nr:MAG: glycosyl transferase group 1 [Ignavibacteriota bacterium]
MANYRINSDAIKILDAHNVEHLIYYHQWQYTNSKLRKFFYKREYKKLFHDEISACKNQDALLVTSQNDASTFDKFIPEIPKYLIPNGVDTEYFHPTEENHEQYSLVFTGALSYIPNSDGAIYFIEQILPHIQKIYPDIKIYIVGKNPPNNLLEKSSKNVIITGYVEDVRPYVWKSAIFVVPLRMGSGTRLKILEALAMKKPVVTTSVGAEGLDVINGETVLIADDPKDFAEKVINLIKDNQLQQKLVSNGYELAKNVYDWIVIGEKLNEVYKTIYSFHKNSRVKKTNHKK